MKKSTGLIMVVCMLLCSLVLVSCVDNVPVIGENGNWFINGEDTGVSATGPVGAPGADGKDGIDGEDGEDGEDGADGIDGADGENGRDGASITVASIKKTTVGEVDTYTITFSDWTTTSYSVVSGTDGKDGESPYVGANGNWWVGETDTGIAANAPSMDRIGTDGLVFRQTIRCGVAGYEVYNYYGTEKDIVIPNELFGKPVISVAEDAFSTSITSVSVSCHTVLLPTFDSYSSLSTFDFNNAPLDTLPNRMFSGCSKLSRIENYENIRYIGDNAFQNSGLVAFDFSRISTIGEKAFYGTPFVDDDYRLENEDRFALYIPATVTAIGAGAFGSGVFVHYEGETAPEYRSGRLFIGVKTSSDGYQYQVDETGVVVLDYVGAETRLTLPEKIEGRRVVGTQHGAFFGNHLIERVELPSSLQTIGEDSFAYCKRLHSLFIPKSVTLCYGLDALCYMQSNGYENTTVFFEAESISYTNGATSAESLGIEKYMMGVTPSRVEDDACFVYVKAGLSWEVVTIKNVARAIVPSTYKDAPVTRILTYALYGNTRTHYVKITDGVEKIATRAFYGTDTLRTLIIPNSVEIINYRAIYDSSGAILVEAKEKPEDWDSAWTTSSEVTYGIDVEKINMDTTGEYLYFASDLDEIMLMDYFGVFKPGVPLYVPETLEGKRVTAIGERCFVGTENGSTSRRYEIHIPSSITEIASEGFYVPGRGYADIYLPFTSSSEIPKTWESRWFYTTSGYSYNSGYNEVYYKTT